MMMLMLMLVVVVVVMVVVGIGGGGNVSVTDLSPSVAVVPGVALAARPCRPWIQSVDVMYTTTSQPHSTTTHAEHL